MTGMEGIVLKLGLARPERWRCAHLSGVGRVQVALEIVVDAVTALFMF